MSFASHTKSTQPVPQEPPDRHKRCATCARAARSPDACCLIVACAAAAGIQRRKRNPNQQRSPQKQASIIGVISFAHKKYKTGAIGAARSYKKVSNVRTARPQPRCIMPDRSMRSRSWHPAPKAQYESANEHQKQPKYSVSFASHTKSAKQVR